MNLFGIIHNIIMYNKSNDNMLLIIFNKFVYNIHLFFRSVSSLKNQMEKEKRNHRQEYLRKLKENSFLLQEIEQLKKELKAAQEYKIPAHVLAKSLPRTRRKSTMSETGSIDR